MAARQLDGVARDVGRDEGIAVAVAADPGAEAEELGELVRLRSRGRRRACRASADFAIEAGQRVEDGDVVVVEAHLDLVVDGGAARADFVGLPEAGDLGADAAASRRASSCSGTGMRSSWRGNRRCGGA